MLKFLKQKKVIVALLTLALAAAAALGVQTGNIDIDALAAMIMSLLGQ